jgi:hypothetical protein
VVQTEGITYTKEPVKDGKLYTARSVLKLKPRKKHHRTTFSHVKHRTQQTELISQLK